MATAINEELCGTIKRPQFTRVGGVALWTAELGTAANGIAIIRRVPIVVWGINAQYAARLPEGSQLHIRGHFKTDRFLTAEGEYLERTTFVVMRILAPLPAPAGLVSTPSAAERSAIT